MKKLVILLFTLLITVISSNQLMAVDWSRIVNLEGNWSFTVGDDMSWANPATNIDDWDQIAVPSSWERYYEGYNGYGWYRRNFNIKILPPNGPVVLFLGQIDDVDEVFVNGVKVGQTGSFFPNYQTAWTEQRKYILPDGLLKVGQNTIAVRVYDEGYDGGMRGGGRIGLYFDNDINLLSYDLSGKWKFTIYREKNFEKDNFDDEQWDNLQVPATWESQGYSRHDGYGWYRKRFTLPTDLMNKELYLVLGKVDDMDKVYINGKQIGRTEDLDRYKSYNRSNAWKIYRVYPVPDGLLQKYNLISVEVYDRTGNGGIYEGPIGFVTRDEAKIILERSENNNSGDNFWSIIEMIFN